MVRDLRIVAFATQGAGGDDEHRLRALLERFAVEIFPFERSERAKSFVGLLQVIRHRRPDLVVMEGTGIGGGLALLLGRLLTGVPYVVSSGDAVGPFVASRHPLLGPAFAGYERALCRFSSGYIGWTPYLAGRALSFGAPRVMTAPGWAPAARTSAERAEARRRVRADLGIPQDALVIGIVGSLAWNPRRKYCYGLELVCALSNVLRTDVRVLIVGDGEGRARLEERAGPQAVFTGRVPREQVPDYLAAMDLASLPQSVDGVGSFRYTTKLSEYLAAGIPVVTGEIPLAYDLLGDWLWRLPGDAPWDRRYVHALAELLNRVTDADLEAKRAEISKTLPLFARERQIDRVSAFVRALLT
jgi:hypothetical protein